MTIIVSILIAVIVVACTDNLDIKREKSCLAAKKRVEGMFGAKLKECDPLHDKNLLKITYAMDYMLDQFQCWQSLHPANDRVIMCGIHFISCAIMLSRTIDMYQDGVKLTVDQERKLIEWRILKKPDFDKYDQDVIRYDILKLVKDGIDCVKHRVGDFCNIHSNKQDMSIWYHIKAAFEIFQSGMEAIKEKEEWLAAAANKEELKNMRIEENLLPTAVSDARYSL
ncbi:MULTISPECIES: hypothetical protein [Ehrlichia]|uniref:Uncharacterized protein n=1 Tax=Ehrlichia cf. muris str. EmCRT TaxID=1359167 RepID=A0A0F3ND29_9RICK|nr:MULTISPECIES: hypothetical protein [Ehrlichia]KJV65592.1 hypothetical protein EMUCRT_0537 [Ehrlichia cf. muris str. EmCRT]OUC04462.1 hypothetical protein DB91_02750 [Ehrlichia sp. Wisconsin_h]